MYHKASSTSTETNHIQLKYSTSKQDASYITTVLANFLEIYVIDSNQRVFTIVYDMPIANGNLKKLIEKNLDQKAKSFWQNKIRDICKEHGWGLSTEEIDQFINCLFFKNRTKEELEETFVKNIIDKYGITTGNETQYVYALYYFCFERMRKGAEITQLDVDRSIQDTRDDISKGVKNPSYNWMHRIDFEEIKASDDNSFFDGKKAEFSDIIADLPVRRENLEQQVDASIQQNQITVIKASSGQGKTTLAYQAVYNVQKTYVIYQITACENAEMVSSIVEFVKARVKVGDQLLLIIDRFIEFSTA